MHCRATLVRLALAALLCGLAACGSNVHFLNTGLPPLPNVSAHPSDGRFHLQVVVTNPTDDDFPAHWFEVKMETTFIANANYCNKTHYYSVYEPLPANGDFTFDPITFDDPPGQPTDEKCKCFKNKCQGHVTITLVRSTTKARISGKKTKFKMNWDGNAMTSLEELD